MKFKRVLLASLCVLAAVLLPVGSSQAAAVKTTGPLLNLYRDSGYSGGIVAQVQATNCGTVGPSARQEYYISWPARIQDSSFEVITQYPYCNVIGVHAYGGGWYQVCTMAQYTRNYWGSYGIPWFGSSANNWYNDNVDVAMVGFFYGCPLNN